MFKMNSIHLWMSLLVEDKLVQDLLLGFKETRSWWMAILLQVKTESISHQQRDLCNWKILLGTTKRESLLKLLKVITLKHIASLQVNLMLLRPKEESLITKSPPNLLKNSTTNFSIKISNSSRWTEMNKSPVSLLKDQLSEFWWQSRMLLSRESQKILVRSSKATSKLL